MTHHHHQGIQGLDCLSVIIKRSLDVARQIIETQEDNFCVHACTLDEVYLRDKYSGKESNALSDVMK
jgi:hypothetical protein